MSEGREGGGVISIESARRKRTDARLREREESGTQVFGREFRLFITDSSVDRLDDLQSRLCARSHGQVIKAAIDILDSCLTAIEEGKRIIAVPVDDGDSKHTAIKDPRFPGSSKPKTPA